jgi:transcriptional regulator CtsR
MSEHLNSDSAHDESEIIEAICDFMIKYPQGGRDFRREVRNLIEQKNRTEQHQLIHDLKHDLEQTVSEIKERYEFAQALLKQQGLLTRINKTTMFISALFHRILFEKNPKVRAEMLIKLHQRIDSSQPAAT